MEQENELTPDEIEHIEHPENDDSGHDDDHDSGYDDGSMWDNEEYEEVDFQGKKYNLPKELKNAFLMQSDYTRKTQEVAEQRKSIEAERAAFLSQVAAQQQHSKLVAKINYLDEQIAEYAAADWNELNAHDPVKTQQLFMQYSQLKDQKAAAEREYHETNEKLVNEQNANLQQKLRDEQAILARDIKDWSPQKAQQLSEFAVNKLGFHPNDVAQVYDAKIVKLLNMAYMADQMISKQAAKSKANNVTDIKETPTVSTKSASTGTKDPSKMSDSEFAKWRRAQIRSR